MNLKAGVYVDGENIMRSGGWGMRYDILKEFVEVQGGSILRANAYLAVDVEREKDDPEYSRAKSDYRSNLRRYGFKLILKPVQRYRDRDGEVITKANADLELAIDSLLQARNLDYVVLVTGDGDFVRLVTALQNMGCRVDVVSFFNTSGKLRDAADNFISGFLLPGLLPAENDRYRGYLHRVDEEKYFGFITLQKSLKLHDIDQDIFCHGREVEGGVLGNHDFARLRGNRRILEFQTATDDKDRCRAVNVSVMKPSTEDRPRRAGAEEEAGSGPGAVEATEEKGNAGEAPEREEDGDREGE